MGYIINLNSSYCHRMQSMIAYAKANGIALPPKAELRAINILLRDAKSTLDKLDLLYLLDGNSSVAFKMINLVNPSRYYGTPIGGGSFTNNAYFGNGVNAYINTGFNPSLLVAGQHYLLDDACRGGMVYSQGSVNFREVFDGCTNGYENGFVVNRAEGNRINSGVGGGNAGDYSGYGLKMIARISNSTIHHINNDVDILESTSSTVLSNATQYILYRPSTSSAPYGSSGIASYFMGASIYNERAFLKVLLNKCRTDRGLSAIN